MGLLPLQACRLYAWAIRWDRFSGASTTAQILKGRQATR